MSDQVIPSQLPESLSFTIREVIPGLEDVLIRATENRVAIVETIIDSIQEKFDEHLEKVAQYYSDQNKLAVPQTIETDYAKAVRVSKDIMSYGLDDHTSINIYDARTSQGNYRGEIIYVNDEYAAQKISAESVILHKLSSLNDDLAVGQSVQFKYDAGVCLISDRTPSAQKTVNQPTSVAANNEPDKYEAVEAFIYRLDAEAKISKPKLSKSSYKGSVIDSPFLLDGYDIQQIGDHSFVIHEVAKFVESEVLIQFGSEHKYRYIYNNGVGNVEAVNNAVHKNNAIKTEVATPSPITSESGEAHNPAAHEAAQSFIQNLDAEAKISEPRLSKSSYKGSVLADFEGYVVQQIGDHSYVIHDLNNMIAATHNIEQGPEHKFRFIYQDGQGRIEKVDSAAEASKPAAQQKTETAHPSPAPPPTDQIHDIKARLHTEAIGAAMNLLENAATEAAKAGKPVKAPALYAARTADETITRGDLLVVNNGYAIQKIGTTTGVVHDRANIETALNLKTVTGPVSLIYQNGKASVEQLPHDFWRTTQKDAVNRAFTGQPAPQRPAPVTETLIDR